MKRVSFVIAALVGITAGAMAQDLVAQATEVAHYNFGDRVISPMAPTPGAFYSNVTNFTGFSVAPAGATGTTTKALEDDITMTAGGQLGIIKFSVGNADAAGGTINARVRVRFFDTTGAGGGPGALIAAVSFNPITFNAGVTVFSSDLTTAAITLPTTFWAAEFFDNVGATATAAQLNSLGLGTFNAVDIGSSADKDFLTTNAGVPAGNDAGAIRTSPFTGNPVANYGWEFNPVPEPTTMAALGLGAIALIRKRRSK